MLTYLRQEAGPADLMRLFGMNEGKSGCESEHCHRSQARWCSYPAWCGKRNIEWHASPRSHQLADHAQLALSVSQVFPFISDKLSAKSQLWSGRWGNEWRGG